MLQLSSSCFLLCLRFSCHSLKNITVLTFSPYRRYPNAIPKSLHRQNAGTISSTNPLLVTTARASTLTTHLKIQREEVDVLVVELLEETAVRLSVETVLNIRSTQIMAVIGEERRDAVTDRVGGGELRRVEKMKANHGRATQDGDDEM